MIIIFFLHYQFVRPFFMHVPSSSISSSGFQHTDSIDLSLFGASNIERTFFILYVFRPVDRRDNKFMLVSQRMHT